MPLQPLQQRRFGGSGGIRVRMAASAALVALLAGCSGAGGTSSSGDDTLNVLMVNNPQMVELQKLTADNFTKETGIKVNFTVLPENDVRDKITQDFSNQAGQYDVATISNFEVPFYAKNGWLHSLDEYSAKDKAFDQADILKPLQESLTAEDGKLYGEPFYGESSFLMYRKDVFEAKKLTMPAKPTWQQVADLAAKVDGAQENMKGICLRGLPGWGEVIAPLTTVVNTMGGTWFTKDWEAQLTSPEFTKATQFYVDLVRDHGQAGAPQSGYAECLNNMTQGNSAMWYDATAGAGSLEAKGSPVKGKIGYVAGPRGQDGELGLALHLGLGHAEGLHQDRERVEVHLLGVQQGVREPRRREDRLGQRARGQARLDLRQPRLSEGRGGLRRGHQGGHRHREPA